MTKILSILALSSMFLLLSDGQSQAKGGGRGGSGDSHSRSGIISGSSNRGMSWRGTPIFGPIRATTMVGARATGIPATAAISTGPARASTLFYYYYPQGFCYYPVSYISQYPPSYGSYGGYGYSGYGSGLQINNINQNSLINGSSVVPVSGGPAQGIPVPRRVRAVHRARCRNPINPVAVT